MGFRNLIFQNKASGEQPLASLRAGLFLCCSQTQSKPLENLANTMSATAILRETIASQEYASIACDLLISSFYQFKVLVEYKSERIRK